MRRAIERKLDGKFSYQRMSRKCDCSHTLGEHAAAFPHDCFAQSCDCLAFKPVPIPTHNGEG